MNPEDLNLEDLLSSSAEELGLAIEGNTRELAAYAAERTAYLSLLVGQPGFEQAVVAERANVALRAGIAAIDTADVAQSRFLGVIQGALSIGAKALAAGVA